MLTTDGPERKVENCERRNSKEREDVDKKWKTANCG
jgi:hypothetical protein